MASARRVGTNENINTYGGTGLGRDYTLLATWEAATDNDLVTATTSEVLECYDDAVFDDSVTIVGATTDASYFRIIRPAPGQGHDGTPNTGVRFVYTGAAGFLIRTTEANLSIQDLVLTYTANIAGGANALHFLGGSSGSVVGCIAYNCSNVGAGGSQSIISQSSSSVDVVDCAVISCEVGFNLNTGVAYNCTAIGSVGIGFTSVATLTLSKNCLASGNGTDFSGTFDAASTTNASSDTTAPGTSSRISQTFTFEDAGSDDYHLTTSDTGALGFGTDLSADATFAFDDDIDGDTIVVWSIGFDSDPVATGGPTPGHSYQYQGKDLGRIGFTRSWAN